MRSKSYQVLDCTNYQEINQDLIDYVVRYTDLTTQCPDYNYCNFLYKFGLDNVHFIKANPKLIHWFESMGLRLRDIYFTLAWTNHSADHPESSCPIHLDKPPVRWKLNWPIMNMEKTSIRFYMPKDPDIDINKLVKRTGDPNSIDNDNYQLEYKDFLEIERHDFAKNQPIIMNGSIAHDVGFYQDPVFPRIGMQVMFFKEPIHLL